jgi:hypothetical protein
MQAAAMQLLKVHCQDALSDCQCRTSCAAAACKLPLTQAMTKQDAANESDPDDVLIMIVTTKETPPLANTHFHMVWVASLHPVTQPLL